MKTEMLKGKKIVLGVTGSIAAYKSALLVRLLIKAGAQVQVVMTPCAKEFITPLTLSTLSMRPVLCEFFHTSSGSWNSHVELGLWADVMLIAPATASTIAKIATGVADNLLITTYLSMKAPIFVAPAMDLDMYAHPTTTYNLNLLSHRGNHIIEPSTGELASQLTGKGRMEEPELIVTQLEAFFSEKELLSGKKILITAGPTYEKIDPVRFIGNYSSGKMGFALAQECARLGADVKLVAGPVDLSLSHARIERIDVESASQMCKVATDIFPSCDAAILCAAVADYTPVNAKDEKMKRIKGESLLLELQPTTDIAATLGQNKQPNQKLVGFALETNDAQQHAQKKLIEKNLDFIVLNSLRDEGAGFRVDTNKITIIDAKEQQSFPLKSKKDAARDIIARLTTLFLLLLFPLFNISTNAQELKATVTLNTSKIQGTNTEAFKVLEDALNEFMNNRKWTNFTFEEHERISCNFTFVVDSYSDDGSFTCSLMVQSLRPVYGSSYSSPIFKYQDNEIKFTYQAYDRLEFQEDYLSNNLTAVLGFYAYMIIGMDLDSMGELGGSEFLTKAQNVANNAQTFNESGWKSGSSTRNRYAIIADYTNGAMLPLRQLMYKYHRLGLDTMYRTPDKGRAAIIESLELLVKAKDDRPLSYLPQLFTEFKQDEFVNIFSTGPVKERQQAVKIFSTINPSLSSTWEKISIN